MGSRFGNSPMPGWRCLETSGSLGVASCYTEHELSLLPIRGFHGHSRCLESDETYSQSMSILKLKESQRLQHIHMIVISSAQLSLKLSSDCFLVGYQIIQLCIVQWNSVKATCQTTHCTAMTKVSLSEINVKQCQKANLEGLVDTDTY